VTKSEAAKLVAVLIAAYQGQSASSKITTATSEVYERMLGDLDYPAANAAVERLLATSKFLPTIAEVRDATLTVTGGGTGGGGEIRPGGEAWGEVLEAIGRYGRNRTPGVDFRFADPVTAECVAALVWRALCDSENQPADRARFIELYDQLAARRRRSQLSESLPAMQRLRALQAAERLEGEAKTLGKLLPLVAGGES
jgi:hypothetical protein